eukprot:3892241-Rhodomonas_salina.6
MSATRIPYAVHVGTPALLPHAVPCPQAAYGCAMRCPVLIPAYAATPEHAWTKALYALLPSGQSAGPTRSCIPYEV